MPGTAPAMTDTPDRTTPDAADADDHVDSTREHVDPSSAPGPPGNPETDDRAVQEGEEKLDRTLPH